MLIKALRSATLGSRAYTVQPLLSDRLMIPGMFDVYQVTTDIPTTLKLSDNREFYLCAVGRKYLVRFRRVESADSVKLVARFMQPESQTVWECDIGEWFRVNPCHSCIRAAIRQFPN